ncbi:MAG: methionine ABC transporter ATP-binding protein [Gammaproteobacteria bacterium CG_4_10_14_0_8_um_filter_38_16]|nr:MAG: methionine ABC transporter ATP-binding protein [Gammaproteobacteria bacterium CG_4_10_14_0_8_um_filter_38_16]PJA03669.1 MAG: methionine ABC transporter ATP-binding protein [Gammaproteobacteria bacterium CG_4_10_14_0_2_um_filter_38_22]PJB11335.1 MAG: methionine ABC transporter ATP-binding protein [Gammaproteobacteria bacterium CG_4_9_14_3_um_filter_38_9]
MIELHNLNKIYTSKLGSHHALKNINLSVAQGEIVGVIGKSGAGKSTLIRCVNLLEKPTSGSVKVNDVDLTTLNAEKLREARHHIGMIFQHFNLLSTRTVFDNIAFPLQLLKKPFNEIERTVSRLLEKVGLSEQSNAYPAQLSGGQKQRVAIARALATNPTVLLCDEMTSALDPETTEDILKLMRSINREFNLSILCITHEMGVIKSIADRVAVIDQGQIVECDKVINVFKNPKKAITKRLIQSVLKSELPDDLQSEMHVEHMMDDQVVLRLTFVGHATLEPVINDFMRKTKARVNILQANIEQLQKEKIGRMIVAMQLEKTELSVVKKYLEEKDVIVEVMGYVDAQTWVA